MSDVTVRFLPPAAALRDAVAFYYVVRIGPGEPVEDLLHPDGAHVRILLSGDWEIAMEGGGGGTGRGPTGFLTGPLSRAAVVRCASPGVMAGVALMPPGWALLTDRSAASYLDRLSPLSELVGDDAGRLVAALASLDSEGAYAAALDAWLLDRRASRPAPDPILADAAVGLDDEEIASVADWARRLGCSTRHLERLTRDYVGLPPKRLLRRQRFLRSSARLREEPLGSWGRVIDEGYADQPQFVREFRYFMGMSPRAYFARPTPMTTAAATARKALAAAQARAAAE